MPRTTLVSAAALTLLATASACGPPRASDGDETGESAEETGPPPDLPLDPPQACVEIERVIELGALELCRVTPTGIVTSSDDEARQTVIHQLVGLAELVEIGRVDNLGGCGGVLVHHSEADRIWLSDDGDWTGDDAPAVLRVLDGAGALLDTIELRHEGLPMTSISGIDHAGRLVLGGAIVDVSTPGLDPSFVQVRDASGEILWTRLGFDSPGSELVTNDLGMLRAAETSLAFLGTHLFTDSFRISLHVLDADDGSLRWDMLVAEDGLPSAYGLGVGPGDRVFFDHSADDVQDMRVFDDAGALSLSQTVSRPGLSLRASSGVRASDSALFQLVGARNLDDLDEVQTHFIQRDLDGEVVCTARLEQLEGAQLWPFEVHGPTRALVGLHDADPEGSDAIVVLRVGWQGG